MFIGSIIIFIFDNGEGSIYGLPGQVVGHRDLASNVDLALPEGCFICHIASLCFEIARAI